MSPRLWHQDLAVFWSKGKGLSAKSLTWRRDKVPRVVSFHSVDLVIIWFRNVFGRSRDQNCNNEHQWRKVPKREQFSSCKGFSSSEGVWLKAFWLFAIAQHSTLVDSTCFIEREVSLAEGFLWAIMRKTKSQPHVRSWGSKIVVRCCIQPGSVTRFLLVCFCFASFRALY